MSAIVTNIITQVKAISASVLGSSYQELQFVYDLGKLNDRTANLGYGVRSMEASVGSSVNRTYALNHRFEIVLTDVYARGNDEKQLADSLGTMYSQADEIFKAMVNTKVNLPLVVLNVFEPTISPPEFIDKIVVLRMQFKIFYRSSLS